MYILLFIFIISLNNYDSLVLNQHVIAIQRYFHRVVHEVNQMLNQKQFFVLLFLPSWMKVVNMTSVNR